MQWYWRVRLPSCNSATVQYRTEARQSIELILRVSIGQRRFALKYLHYKFITKTRVLQSSLPLYEENTRVGAKRDNLGGGCAIVIGELFKNPFNALEFRWRC